MKPLTVHIDYSEMLPPMHETFTVPAGTEIFIDTTDRGLVKVEPVVIDPDHEPEPDPELERLFEEVRALYMKKKKR